MKHNNNDISREIVKTLNVKGEDQGIGFVDDTMKLSIESNPKIVKDANVHSITSATSSGVQTVLSTSAYPDKIVRIKTIMLSYVKDAACDIATGGITVQITNLGIAKTLVSLPVITLTAQSQSIVVHYANGIPLDPNTAISVTGTFTAGVCVRSCQATITVEDK